MTRAAVPRFTEEPEPMEDEPLERLELPEREPELPLTGMELELVLPLGVMAPPPMTLPEGMP